MLRTFLLPRCPAREELGCTRSVRGQSQNSWPKMTKGISHIIWSHVEWSNWEKGRGRGNISSDSVCFHSKLVHKKNCFPESGWTSHWQWEVVNEFLVLLCLHSFTFTLSLSQPLSFHSFTLMKLFLIPIQKSEKVTVIRIKTSTSKKPSFHLRKKNIYIYNWDDSLIYCKNFSTQFKRYLENKN